MAHLVTVHLPGTSLSICVDLFGDFVLGIFFPPLGFITIIHHYLLGVPNSNRISVNPPVGTSGISLGNLDDTPPQN